MIEYDVEPYKSSLFVGREGIIQELIQRLLAPTPASHKHRSTIIRGSGKCGKSWLLHRIQEILLTDSQAPIVLMIKSEDFNRKHINEAALFRWMLKTLWPLVEQATTNVETDTATTPLLPALEDYDEYPVAFPLRAMAEKIDQVKPPQHIIILLDGMEEIHPELLKQFEHQFIVPMFKYSCVRMVATCRIISNNINTEEPSWTTRIVKPHNIKMDLRGFDDEQQNDPAFPLLPAEQFERLKKEIVDSGGGVRSVEFAQLQAQLPRYSWNNPGANAYLMRRALDTNGQLRTDTLEICIDRLLRLPDGSRFDQEYKQWLFRLVKQYPDFEEGLNIARINETLEITDDGRQLFTSALWTAGHGEIEQRRLFVNREIVTLIRSLQERKSL